MVDFFAVSAMIGSFVGLALVSGSLSAKPAGVMKVDYGVNQC
jgi:hypothetical protein